VRWSSDERVSLQTKLHSRSGVGAFYDCRGDRPCVDRRGVIFIRPSSGENCRDATSFRFFRT
jgi:hypothetical protein